MGRRFAFVLAVVFCCGAIQASAEHSSGPAEMKAVEETATHGIVRAPRFKAPESAKAAEPAGHAKPAATEPAKAKTAGSAKPEAAEHAKAAETAGAAAKPAAPAPVSTEAVAAAIAKAVRTAEEARKPAPAAAAPRTAQPAPPAKLRRYTVRWPTQRFEVSWETPDDRVRVSWNAGDPTTSPRDDQRVAP